MADSIATAFVVHDAAGRWDKPVAFSSKCTVAVDPTYGSFVVHHRAHVLDDSWRIIFPVFSIITRLAPCLACLRSPNTLCDNGLPCLSCQNRDLPCRASHVLIAHDDAVDGEAEMNKAAEESALIARSGEFRKPLMKPSYLLSPAVVHEGYVPMAAIPTHNMSLTTTHKPRPVLMPLITPTHKHQPKPMPLTPTHKPKPRPVPNSVVSRPRRPNRLQETKSPIAEAPEEARTSRVAAAERLGRAHKLWEVRSGPVLGYSMQNDQAPPWVELGGLEITMAEMAVFLLNLAQRPEGAMRMVDNGWTAYHYCKYHNWARAYKGETRHRGGTSEGAIRSTFTKSLQRTMRVATGDNSWTQTSHKLEPTTNVSTAAWLPLINNAPTHPLRAMGSHVSRWPPESHSLNLTRAVRYACDHPHIPDDQLQFPTHVRSVVEKLPGGFRRRALEATAPNDNLDQTILVEWIKYQERHADEF